MKKKILKFLKYTTVPAAIVAGGLTIQQLSFTDQSECFIDSVKGSDSNSGTSEESAWGSIEKFKSVYGDSTGGMAINLARGSWFREELIVGNNNTIKTYGSGHRPILDASDVATNSLWAKEATASNVWKMDWVSTGGGYQSVVEDNIQLYRTNSVVNCDSAPGSFYVATLDVNPGTTNTVYIHPRGSTTPTNDAKLYEINKRNYGLLTGNNNRIEGVHTRNQLSNNGSLEAGQDCFVRDVFCENGTKHNFLIESGVVEDYVFFKQEYSKQSATLGVSYTTAANGRSIYRRGYVGTLPGYGQLASGIYSHAGFPYAQAGYPYLVIEDTIAEHAGSIGGLPSTNGFSMIKNCTLLQGAFSILGNGSTNILVNCRVLTTPAFPISDSGSSATIYKQGGQVWISGCQFSGWPYGIRVDNSTNTDIRILRTMVKTGNWPGIFTVNGGGNTLTISNSVIHGMTLTAGNTISSADRNIYPNANYVTVNGVPYIPFSAYVSALLKDVNSITNDMKYLSNPNLGDFGYSITSPAVSNFCGTGWVQSPVPFGLFSGPTPPNLVIGIP